SQAEAEPLPLPRVHDGRLELAGDPQPPLERPAAQLSLLGGTAEGTPAGAGVLAPPRRRRPRPATRALHRDARRLRRPCSSRGRRVNVFVAAPPSPYKGLAPFEDSDLDALLFFGRERESEVIAANLMASRITVLYGPSGVGKSSVLRAGVAHRLRREQEVEVVVFSTWTGDPVSSLIEATGASGDSLADALGEATSYAGGDLYLILDQFEEC